MQPKSFGDAEVSALAQVERQMDAGTTQYVLCPMVSVGHFRMHCLNLLG